MPIRPEYRWFYPIGRPQLSALIRFERAQGRYEGCGQPHGRLVCHLGDGRWYDADGRETPPMTLANMRENGVRSVEAKCEACGHGPR